MILGRMSKIEVTETPPGSASVYPLNTVPHPGPRVVKYFYITKTYQSPAILILVIQILQ
jgi:hypothetical protein